MPLPLSPHASASEPDFEAVLEALGRLRDYLSAQGLASTHPHMREVEDLWWRTKRFLERIERDPESAEEAGEIDSLDVFRLYER